MVGSTQSTAGPTFVLNTIVADVLNEIADELEKAKDVEASAQKILQRIANEHGRIIFNGDNYTADWAKEAEKRKLPNIRSTVSSISTIMDKENVEAFQRQQVLSKEELHARTEILLEAYSMQINIEARTMLSIARRQIMPVVVEYAGSLADAVNTVKAAGIDAAVQKSMLQKVSELAGSADKAIKGLEGAVANCAATKECLAKAELSRDKVIPAMSELRKFVDELESNVDASLWPLPTYAEMLFLK
jgi:glutamine synthetase